MTTGFDVGVDAAGIGRVGGTSGAKEAKTFEVILVTTFGGLVLHSFNASGAERVCRVGTTGKV